VLIISAYSVSGVNIYMALLILKSSFSDSEVLLTVSSLESLADIFTSQYEYFWMTRSVQPVLPVNSYSRWSLMGYRLFLVFITGFGQCQNPG